MLVVAGLPGQVRELLRQMIFRVAQLPCLGGEPERRLHHREGNQLRVGQFGAIPATGRDGASSGLAFKQIVRAT